MSRSLVFWILALAAVAAATWHAAALAWTCDDAFITFRYAQHFVDGHGLVFNLDPSEAPVEGYTNFSWTMWMALGAMLGFEHVGMESWSIFWGVVCHGGVVLLLSAMAWRASAGRAWAPVAACAYAAIHHAASLAPAGLETALFVLLATAMARFAMSLRCRREAALMGFIGVLCAMTRPDGGLFVAMGGLFVLYDAWQRRAPALLVGYVAPFALVLAPYLLWRRAYYGYWVPNTAFAKAAGSAHWDLGWTYVADFFLCYWALLPALGAALWFLCRRADPLAPISPFLGRRPWLVFAAFFGPYVGFVVYVGGDFMFSRFLLPVLPLLLFSWDVACTRWNRAWVAPTLAAALAVGLQVRIEPDGLTDFTRAVSDNRRISFQQIAGHTLVDISHGCGAYLRRLFEGQDVRIGIAGGHANLAFLSEAPVAVEVAGGLTDAYIAHMPPGEVFKPGHNRPWTQYPDYLVERGMHFMFELSYGKDDPWREVVFPCRPVPVPAKLVIYDRALMGELKRRDPALQFVDFEAFLDDYLAGLPGQSKAQVAADLRKFRRFYFDHNEDPARLQRFESFLR
jgi:arabinofuranosyltransferase